MCKIKYMFGRFHRLINLYKIVRFYTYYINDTRYLEGTITNINILI